MGNGELWLDYWLYHSRCYHLGDSQSFESKQQIKVNYTYNNF